MCSPCLLRILRRSCRQQVQQIADAPSPLLPMPASPATQGLHGRKNVVAEKWRHCANTPVSGFSFLPSHLRQPRSHPPRDPAERVTARFAVGRCSAPSLRQSRRQSSESWSASLDTLSHLPHLWLAGRPGGPSYGRRTASALAGSRQTGHATSTVTAIPLVPCCCLTSIA